MELETFLIIFIKMIFDYLPLVSLSSLQNSVIPTANFTASVTNGPAPLVVKFTDLSKNAVVWNWDFDNDGISDSTEQNPVYVYRDFRKLYR